LMKNFLNDKKVLAIFSQLVLKIFILKIILLINVNIYREM